MPTSCKKTTDRSRKIPPALSQTVDFSIGISIHLEPHEKQSFKLSGALLGVSRNRCAAFPTKGTQAHLLYFELNSEFSQNPSENSL
jgi:hypothetical protein